MERQRIKVEELPQTLPKHEKRSEISADGYSTNKLKINSSGLQEMDQKELSSDNDWRTEGSSGDYRSDEISRDVDNYTDAQNTMESEMNTDSENNVKLNLGFTTMTQRMNSSTVMNWSCKLKTPGQILMKFLIQLGGELYAR